MNCPKCGAETNESICPVCGATVGGNSGFALAGDSPQQNASYDAQPVQPGMVSPGAVSSFDVAPDQGMTGGAEPQQDGITENNYGADDFGMDDQPYQATYITTNKRSGMGALVGILVAIVAVVAIAAVVIVKMGLFENGAKKSEAVIDKFFTGIEEADMDKVLETVDSKCVGDNDAETLSESFELLTSMGVEYSIDYTINSTEKANRATIKNMCDKIYDGKSSDVSKAYICDLDYTMNMTYLGESQSETDSMSLICYKKGGKWYIGGSVEDTE